MLIKKRPPLMDMIMPSLEKHIFTENDLWFNEINSSCKNQYFENLQAADKSFIVEDDFDELVNPFK